ncbi:MAG: hypothetical protein AB7O66_03480 [Limisphaerales bacterium]
MSQLEKAQLQPIKADGSTDGPAIPVQFNPATLRLQITNQVEGGDTRGRQVRQYTGSSSTQLTVELIFDTADEGTTQAPVSVRSKTLQVEQFLYPRGDDNQKQAPPQLRFEWGDLILEGVVESLTIDLDHFASNGFPLRAKVGFSLKEQDRRYELKIAGDAANTDSGATRPGEAGSGALGTFNAGFGAQVGLAIGGESAAEFTARLGLDPSAWRGLSFGASLEGSLSFEAGLEVGFSAGLSANVGLGVYVGASAGLSVSLEASFGLEVDVGVTAVANVGVSANLQAGFSLAAAGGLSAAIASVKTAKADTAVAATKTAFGLTASAASNPGAGPGSATGSTTAAGSGSGSGSRTSSQGGSTAASAVTTTGVARPTLPAQTRTPMRLAGIPTPAAQQGAPSAPPPPVADPRASSFGFGVPLRATVRPGAEAASSTSRGTVPLAARTGTRSVPTTRDPTVPAWVALPESSVSANAKTGARGSRRGTPCDCAGPNALKGNH